MRYPGPLLSVIWVINDSADCALVRAVHGMDLGNGRSDVQHLPTEAGRLRARFSHARSKGLAFLPPLFLNFRNAEIDAGK